MFCAVLSDCSCTAQLQRCHLVAVADLPDALLAVSILADLVGGVKAVSAPGRLGISTPLAAFSAVLPDPPGSA
ncbi:tail tape measure protein [Pseudomonas phage PIP]|nr:tail tape measure protein [Pseudomonas phage PIP]